MNSDLKSQSINTDLKKQATKLVEEGLSFFADLGDIQVKPQIRRRFRPEKVLELAKDIDTSRQLEPAILRRSKEPPFTYELISGEYRKRAQDLRKQWWIKRGAPAADLTDPDKPIGKLWAVFLDVDDVTARRYQISENRRRVDVDLLDDAFAVLEDYERLGTLDAVMDLWQENRAWVSKNLNIARRLRDTPASIPSNVTVLLEDNFSKDLNVVYQLLGLSELSPDTAAAVATAVSTAMETHDDSFKVRDVVSDTLREVKADIKAGGDGKILPRAIATKPTRQAQAAQEWPKDLLTPLPTRIAQEAVPIQAKEAVRLPTSTSGSDTAAARPGMSEQAALRALFLALKTRGTAADQFSAFDPELQQALMDRWQGLWQRGSTAVGRSPDSAMDSIANGFQLGGFSTDNEKWFDFRSFMLGALNAPLSADKIIQ
ncbi:ParB/RepB/Spo0J family partition protein [Chitinimonas sp. BJB300]|uniref:ParB/RepB/Spo0J family partition protein n=1 Tax=Chitinimonas sp. BJB300 TaxID=1559339 RepID=UPI000C102DBA|nr:ParB N-terminal domain-containing protein [Chitinimonas sp. BJB300]PHV12034.1 hypothetical protein CSQ89_07790 [Chitinimonas sp. BJB300]TSJ84928.1 hypothetical protein FG002_018390 [Chitinimonas sp. BJB300]